MRDRCGCKPGESLGLWLVLLGGEEQGRHRMCVKEEWQQPSHRMAQPLLPSLVQTSDPFGDKVSKFLVFSQTKQYTFKGPCFENNYFEKERSDKFKIHE